MSARKKRSLSQLIFLLALVSTLVTIALRGRSDFGLQEQPKDNIMVSISRAWHNGSFYKGQ